MKRFAVQTLGCKVNQSEEEKIRHDLILSGFKEVGFKEFADIYIINTCTVTHLADHKSRKLIRQAKKANSDALILVAGCIVGNSQALKGLPDGLLYLSTSQKKEILKYIPKSYFKIEKSESRNVFFLKRTRAMVKIQDGCNNFCSYCIVPVVRGGSISLKTNDILKQINQLEKDGHKEVVLTGINLNYYGRDLSKKTSLSELIELICEKTKIKRIRLSSLEPYNFDFKLIDMAKKYPQVCRHFHIPLQHASNSILKSMNRGYLIKDYKNIVNSLFKDIPEAALTTDVITGLPGEEEQDFGELYKFIKNTAFSRIHVFKYSRRPKTPAFSFSGQVPEEIKNTRSKILIHLAVQKKCSFEDRFIGRVMEVLIEGYDSSGCLSGYTDNYLRITMEGNSSLRGKIITAMIKKKRKNGLFGEIV